MFVLFTASMFSMCNFSSIVVVMHYYILLFLLTLFFVFSFFTWRLVLDLILMDQIHFMNN